VSLHRPPGARSSRPVPHAPHALARSGHPVACHAARRSRRVAIAPSRGERRASQQRAPRSAPPAPSLLTPRDGTCSLSDERLHTNPASNRPSRSGYLAPYTLSKCSMLLYSKHEFGESLTLPIVAAVPSESATTHPLPLIRSCRDARPLSAMGARERSLLHFAFAFEMRNSVAYRHHGASDFAIPEALCCFITRAQTAQTTRSGKLEIRESRLTALTS
jgi:hypothetical protein